VSVSPAGRVIDDLITRLPLADLKLFLVEPGASLARRFAASGNTQLLTRQTALRAPLPGCRSGDPDFLA